MKIAAVSTVENLPITVSIITFCGTHWSPIDRLAESPLSPRVYGGGVSADMDNTDKVVVIIEECRQMKLVVRPASCSNYKFTVNDNHIVGMGAIKGVGEAPRDAQRAEAVAVSGFMIYASVSTRKVNRRVLSVNRAFYEFDDNRAAGVAAMFKSGRQEEMRKTARAI
jgi:DNA polymerase III alpha subunit